MLRVVISGATGAVGRALVPAVEAEADLAVAAVAAPSLGTSLAEALAGGADVAVDFTVPAAAPGACEAAIAARVPLVLGTTGLRPTISAASASARLRPACRSSPHPTSRSARC